MNDPANLDVPYTQFDFYNYYVNAQGEIVYLKNVNKPVTAVPPKEVDMSTFVPDALDPGNAPFIFPPGITVSSALAAQQALATTADGNTTTDILALAQTALKAETAQAAQVLMPTTTTPMTATIEGFKSVRRGDVRQCRWWRWALLGLLITWITWRKSV